MRERPSGSGDYALKIEVEFPVCATLVDRYTRIYAYMSCVPHEIYNLTSYSGISFDFGVMEMVGQFDVFIQLTDTVTHPTAWHIAPIDISKYHLANDDSALYKTYIPFTNFVYPQWHQAKKHFSLDLSNMYRVSFLFVTKEKFKGKAHGIFFVDNIKFVSG